MSKRRFYSIEQKKEVIRLVVESKKPVEQDLSAADEVVDFLNNAIGRQIAAGLSGDPSSIAIARQVLREQRDSGLWNVVRASDGKFSIKRKRISQEQFRVAMNKLNTLAGR